MILQRFFRRIKRRISPIKVLPGDGRGLFLFAHTGDVIRAETLLRKAELPIAVKAPPPELRTGCDLAIEFSLAHESFIRTIMEQAGLIPVDCVPITGEPLEPASLFQCKDFGDYLMVRMTNMKITVEKSSKRIVNVSGGGCPDVPYLASLLTGKRIEEVDPPKNYGQTLCAYALQLAFEEAKRLCAG
ncbi:MAG: DUF3343 domain-containing protein [Deltaproteobacteria bacterium]|jgi:hypothetical protein|nr:DUF3343 domain-containing protein [Deltaproteobacteria bacterium]